MLRREASGGAQDAPGLATSAIPAAPAPMSPTSGPDAPTRPVSRTARMLALAYRIDGLVQSGEIRDYAQAAKRIGITRARMSQILALLNLSPSIQESLLTGSLLTAERQLRAAAGMPLWM